MRMSVDKFLDWEQFLDWEPGDGRAWQLVDGEPQAMSPAKRTHGALQGEPASLTRNHLVGQDSPCSVVVTPGIVPRVQARCNMRIPDLTVTCTDYEKDEVELADPVLIIEILSPSNQVETWPNIWTYMKIPSVQEILILRSIVIGADILRRLPMVLGRRNQKASLTATLRCKASVSGCRWPLCTAPRNCDSNPADKPSETLEHHPISSLR